MTARDRSSSSATSSAFAPTAGKQSGESERKADALLETFSAYLDAARKADEVFLDYKLMRVGEGKVHQAQLHQAAARQAHLDAISEVRRG